MTAKKTWWSSGSGLIELLIPNEAITDCSHSGSCDVDVDYWVDMIGWRGIKREIMEKELKEYGAWDDLSTVDIRTLKERLTWLACCDLREEQVMNERSN